MNKVCVYFELLHPGGEDEEVLRLCRTSWHRNGWQFVVAGLDDAKRHPRYQEFLEKVRNYPTVNDRRYETICYVRWLAFDLFTPAVFIDHDIINFGFRPEDLPIDRNGCFLNAASGVTPVFYTSEGTNLALRGIMEWNGQPAKHFGKDHISDMFLAPRLTAGKYAALDICRSYGDKDWQNKPLAHFYGPKCKTMRVQMIELELSRRRITL